MQLPDGKTTSAPTAPGAFAVLTGDAVFFQNGKSAVGTALETLAEDGNPEPLVALLTKQAGVKQAGLILPGQPVTVTAEPGDRIAFASMFVQSNDLFYAPNPRGIGFFNAEGVPAHGELTSEVALWDAGTETMKPRESAPTKLRGSQSRTPGLMKAVLWARSMMVSHTRRFHR